MCCQNCLINRDRAGLTYVRKCGHRKRDEKVGINDRARDRKEQKAAAAAEKRKRRANSTGSGNVADWATVDGTLLCSAVAAIARSGGAVRLGYTRDGGAYAVGIYGDGDPFTEYVSPNEDMSEWLKGLIEDYER